MNHKCDQLRNRAMERGEGSEEYAAWVRHCRHCSDCRSELFILETLREDADDEKVHLPREKVAQLAMMAKARYGKRHNRRTLRIVWGFLWKTAALAAMIVLLLNILPLEHLHRHGMQERSPQAVAYSPEKRVQMARGMENGGHRLSAETDANGFMPFSPGEASYEHHMELVENAQFMDMVNLLPEQAFDHRIREAGLRIRRQREELNTLIDYDLAGY